QLISPSKVGLSARQRAMLDASQVGIFRFARIKRATTPVSVASGGGAPSVTNLDIDDGSCAPAPLVLPGVGGNGGGICRTPSMRNPSNVAVGPTPFQSPMAPYRRSTPPLPAANHRQSQAGVGRLPGDGNVNATGGMAPPPTVALASAIMHELNARQSDRDAGVGGPAANGRLDDMTLVSESVPVLPASAQRTEVLANFVRPGRGALVQPGLQKMPTPPENEVSE
ncbi:hypothetical protein Vretifemale_6646, partial [Volvox reticuliferus]